MNPEHKPINRYIQEKTEYFHDGTVFNIGKTLRLRNCAVDALCTIALISTLASSVFIVGEGERGVVTRFGEAIRLEGVGLGFKAPIIDAVNKIEIRERKTIEVLSSATKNQLPVSATVSINWIADTDAVMNIYKDYGSLSQFQDRILNPKLRQAAKAAISKFNADDLIRNRQAATSEILSILTELMKGYPVTVNSPQIENIELPEVYLNSVLEKEKAREDAAKEQYNLERQKLESLREVQSAEAARDAAKAVADGNAYRIRTEAEADADATRLRKAAEAEGIRDIESALAQNPLFIDYTRALQWNGQLPTTVMGENQGVLMGINPR